MSPQRVQLSRRKGWKMPPNTVRVARPSIWGNRYRVGDRDVTDAATAVRLYRESIEAHTGLCYPEIETLRGKNLACWCPIGSPCHADVLLEIANRTEPWDGVGAYKQPEPPRT